MSLRLWTVGSKGEILRPTSLVLIPQGMPLAEGPDYVLSRTHAKAIGELPRREVLVGLAATMAATAMPVRPAQAVPGLAAIAIAAVAVGAAAMRNALLEKALSVSRQVRTETAVGKIAVSIPVATLNLAERIFGGLEGRTILLLGTGKMTELSAREMVNRGAVSITVIDQSPSRAQELAEKLGGTAATLADRWKCMLRADIVITSTGCPHVVLTHEEAERIATERNRVALVIIDVGMPRDVDPGVRRVDGILLYDLDSLEKVVKINAAERRIAIAEADRIIAAEAPAFQSRLKAEQVVPTIVALRHRLDEICRQELESFIAERGPFTREQDQSLHAITTQVIQKIASSLARELKEFPEKEEQQQMAAAVSRLFHLDSPQQAPAGTILERQKNEQRKPAIAFNH